MRIHRAVPDYVAWLSRFMPIVKRDLALKHRLMAASPFAFLRATFFRWAQQWHELADELSRAPRVLGVGDLHVENFGTWRDAEARLVWGINDFDEAAPMPYVQDLVRLATSAVIAIRFEHLAMRPREACEAVLEGYRASLELGGRPFVLEEENDWLRDAMTGELRSPVAFWEKMTSLPTTPCRDREVHAALDEALPGRDISVRVSHRVAGLGSLGRPRYVAIGQWHGGLVAREAKALAPSGWAWASGSKSTKVHYADVVARAVRSRDPYLRVHGGWVVRRLAPHCARIELAELPRTRDEHRLLHAMGFETANVHLGTKGARVVLRRDLAKRGTRWLRKAVDAFVPAVEKDWERWRKAMLRE